MPRRPRKRVVAVDADKAERILRLVGSALEASGDLTDRQWSTGRLASLTSHCPPPRSRSAIRPGAVRPATSPCPIHHTTGAPPADRVDLGTADSQLKDC
jgi:hypothetical protein